MNRREALGAFGLAGAGLGARGADAPGDRHGTPGGKVKNPAGNHHLAFCGIHVVKTRPKVQFLVHHYCGPLGEVHQCLLYDSRGKGARLLGVEYIIPDRMYRRLPDAEKKYWHPHSYEALAGGLIAEGMPPEEEMAFMKELVTTWGKAWHTWPDPTTAVPTGAPLLMWSITGDGQADEELVARRDKELGASTAKVRAKRVADIGLEVPQVPQPKSLDTIGRQWTAVGEDRPRPRKR